MHRRRRRRDRSDGDTYVLRERAVAIGDDYWIETEAGRRAFKVDGKVLRARDTFVLKDAHGQELLRLKHRPVRVRQTWKVERPGKPDATLRKAMVTPLRDRWVLEADDLGEWKIQGNIVEHEYTIEDADGDTIAESSKRWLRVRDSYGVRVQPAADAALVLAATVAIDQDVHD